MLRVRDQAAIGAAVGNLTIDDTLSQGDLLHIADVFRGLPSSNLATETLPETIIFVCFDAPTEAAYETALAAV